MQRALMVPGSLCCAQGLLLSGSLSAWEGVAARQGLSVRPLNRSYRKRCLVPLLFSQTDREAHRAMHGNALTRTHTQRLTLTPD